MSKSNGNNVAQRLEFLERIFIEDRKRWRQSEDRWRLLETYIRRNESLHTRHEAHHLKHDRTVDRILAKLAKHDGHLEALLKELHQRKEHRL